MIFSIWDELKIPVKLVCFGQQLDDIDFYSPQRVVDAILGITAVVIMTEQSVETVMA